MQRIISIGDKNGWVGVEKDTTEKVVGPFGVPRENMNGYSRAKVGLPFSKHLSHLTL